MKSGAVDHRVDRDDARRRAGAARVAGQSADRPFGEHAEPFLDAFIAGEPGAEDR